MLVVRIRRLAHRDVDDRNIGRRVKVKSFALSTPISCETVPAGAGDGVSKCRSGA